ncbi:MAG: hypothetical protein QM731_23300 [Chitinophagaceae bacterium]
MKKKIIPHIVFCCGLLLISMALDAQVLVKAFVDRDKILIGDSIRLTLDAHVPLGEPITWFQLDSLPHFEFISKGKIDTVDGIDGKKLEQIVIITSYDSGYWQLPQLELHANDKSYYTDSLGITVSYTPADLSQDYHDIKEIEDVPPSKLEKYLPWIIAGGVLLIGAIVILTLRILKKRRTEPDVPVIKLTPYEEAMQAMSELRKKGWDVQGEEKAYYTKLNNILRQFIARKLNIASLEKTNDELIQQLRRSLLDDKSYKQLAEALHVADFVKFARYTPGAEDNEKNFNIIQSAITTLNNT